MELRSLRAFVTVADAGSVTEAGRMLHLSQPAVSRLVQGLERELAVALFDRLDNRLILTSAGRQLVPVARDLLARADRALQVAQTLREGRLASVTVSSPPTTLSDVVAPFVATWRPEDPTPHVVETRGGAAASYDVLRRGVDLAIGTEPPPPWVAAVPVAVLPVWAYVPPGHRWAGRRRIGLEDAVHETLLVLDEGQHARRAVHAALRERDLALGSSVACGQPEVAQALAAAGRGVALVSDDARFGLVPLALTCGDRPVVVRLVAAWDPAHHAADALADIARRLGEFCRERYPGGGFETRASAHSSTTE